MGGILGLSWQDLSTERAQILGFPGSDRGAPISSTPLLPTYFPHNLLGPPHVIKCPALIKHPERARALIKHPERAN